MRSQFVYPLRPRSSWVASDKLLRPFHRDECALLATPRYVYVRSSTNMADIASLACIPSCGLPWLGKALLRPPRRRG